MCALEGGTPIPGGGRPDIRLTNGRRVVHLESKVEAELTLKQLKKYRESGVKVLIAITKYRPDVPPAELWQHRIRTLRWQDVHRQLNAARSSSGKDGFLFRAFTDYLEETGMAYDEGIRSAELQRLGLVLRTMSLGVNRGRAVKRRVRNCRAMCQIAARHRRRGSGAVSAVGGSTPVGTSFLEGTGRTARLSILVDESAPSQSKRTSVHLRL